MIAALKTIDPAARAFAIRCLQVAMTVILLLLLWRLADGRGALGMLATAHPIWLACAAVLLILHTLFAALRWRVAAAPLGIHLSRKHAIGEYFLAQLINTTVPGGVFGDVGRATRSRHDAGLGAAAGAVVVERAIGQLAMLVVLSAGFLITLTTDAGILWPLPLAIILSVALVAVWLAVAIGLVVSRRSDSTTRSRPARGRSARGRSARGRTERGRSEQGRIDRLRNGLRRSLTAPGAPLRHTILSAATAVSILSAFGCCALAVGAPLSVAALVAVVPLVLLAMLIPVSIAGWGVREGAAVALLPMAGIAASQAFAVSVAFGLVGLIAALPGFAALWRRRPSRPGRDSAAERRSTSETRTPRRTHE